MLVSVSGFRVRISDDGASLVIATGADFGSLTVPVPLHSLMELRLRDDPRVSARYMIPTGLPATDDARWVEIVFTRDKPWLIGALPLVVASELVDAFAAWRAAHPIDVMPTPVAEADLFADPTRWHGRRVETEAQWHYAFENCGIRNVWVRVPEHSPVAYGTYRARIVGTWLYPVAGADRGYGHMGCWAGELLAETIDILEVIHQPSSGRDGLTGLLTRRAIGGELQRALDAGQGLAFAMLDLDHFKRYNDAHGHEAGDSLLRRIAKTLVDTLRPIDIAVRFGGEEFAIVMPATTLDTARSLIGRVRTAIAPLGITASAGLVVAEEADTPSSICERADRAVYRAKQDGRDRICER